MPASRGPGLTDFQSTLDALPPGAFVRVPSGNYGPAWIRKPMTLIGEDPTPTFESLQLDGAGGGTLSLVNLRTNSDLVGTGFDQLKLFDVEVAANRVRVRKLRYVEATRLSFSPVAFGALEAPGATVVLLDSAIGTMAGARLYQAGSACFSIVPTEFAKALKNDLTLTQPVLLGSHLTLTWSVPGPVAVLVATTRTQEPLRVPRAASGCWHLAGGLWMRAAIATPGALTVQVPPAPILTGTQVSFQVIGPNRYLSRPATAVVR